MHNLWKIQMLYLLLFFAGTAYGNDTLLMRQILERIDELQVKQNGAFPKGSIAAYRMYSLNKDRQKADLNPFYSGLVAFTLKNLKNDLTPSQRILADQIIANTVPVFAKFKNQKGRPTYNMWPTDTPKIFTNSGWLNLFDKKQALPDDFDDTVITLLALDTSDSTARQVHTLMQSFTNNRDKQIRNTFSNYRNLNAYSTWFGKKMPVDFDICVHTNVLYFVEAYHLDWTPADSATLHLIEMQVAEKKYLSAPAYISPYYNTTANILYHLSRLMSLKPIPALEKYRQQLIEDTKNTFLNANSFMDEVVLSTSLLRWNVEPPIAKPHTTKNIYELVEEDPFSFFIADIAIMLPNPLKQWFGWTGLGKFYYYSDAYNETLLLENLVWRKRRGLH
jgi:hypothetical protein